MAKKKNNFEMNVVESGYEDDLQKRLEEEKQKLKAQQDNTDTGITDFFTTKRVLLLLIWAIGYRLFINWGFGVV
jgi:hypothetical protein